MNKFFLTTLLTASIYTFGFSQQVSTIEKEVNKAIKVFNKAFAQADIATLNKHLTEQYIHSNSGSTLIYKKGWLNYIKKRRKQLDTGVLKVTSYQMSELIIKVYHQHSAIANALITSSGVNKGKPFTSKIRVTQVWIKEQGIWKRAAFHDSKLKN